MKLLSFAVAFVAVSTASAIYPINGTCPRTVCDSISLNVTADQLTGIWYLQGNIPHSFEKTQKCTYTNITFFSDNTIDIAKFGYTHDNLPIETMTVATINNGFLNGSYGELEIPVNYHVIALNPEYKVLFECNECGFFSTNGSGIVAKVYTRLVRPSCELLDSAFNDLIKCGVPHEAIVLEDQQDCNFC